MTIVLHQVMQSDPNHLHDVWHLSLSKDGRGSPSDAIYDGGMFKMDGMTRENTIRLLRRLADLVEQGRSMKDIGIP